MIKEYANPGFDARFAISSQYRQAWVSSGSYLMFLWNDGEKEFTITIDDRELTIKPNQIACTTYLHKVQIDNQPGGLKTLFFNREFYCVHTNDSEVSCNGLLFFGSNTSPVLELSPDESERLRTLYGVLTEEFDMVDASQEEMLRILLKRFIIRCTRLAKNQLLKSTEKQSDIDVVRRFNVLVEEHFKSKKTVGEYAELLFKSPKTVTNIFGKYSEETPLRIIHNRIIMEAKRMLLYTDKTAKEIGYELGYDDPAQFSKLFKHHTGKTTNQFKNSKSEMSTGKN